MTEATEIPAVQAAYEKGLVSLSQLALDHGMTRSALVWLARKHGWMRRGATPKPGRRRAVMPAATAIAELRELVQSRLQALETAMGAIGAQVTAASGEREIRELSLLTRTLEKVIELERKHGSSTRRGRAVRAIDDARRDELARRLAALGGDRQRRSGGGGADTSGSEAAADGLAPLGASGPAAG